MKVTEIRRESEMGPLRSDWESLLRVSASDTIFLTWEWVNAWWSAYGNAGDLRIFTAADEKGVLRGIAPLRRQTMRRGGQTVSALSFLGDGSNDSEYLDCIAATGYEEQVMAAFRGYWTSQLEQGYVLALNEVPDTSPNLAYLRDFAHSRGLVAAESQTACGTVRLPESWDGYLGTLKPRFRTKIRSVLRNLESRPGVRFGFCETREEVERILPVLYDLHARRWAQDGKPGVFGWDRKRRFYALLSAALKDRGWLRVSWLAWHDRILACQYGFLYGGTYYHLQEGYEPASEHWNVGIGLRAWTIREFLQQGVREYDFLGGVGRHKLDWGAETKYSRHLVIGGYKRLLFCRGPEWNQRAREAVRGVLPERALAARSAWLERKAGEGGASNGVRRVAAQCYYGFGLPALVRPLRERYELCGRGWRKRTQPSVRILYYHQVNDDQDPFGTAISTKLFEEQMRFVARHYRVVTLDEAVKHLVDAASAETVLAITFDDGYQDNYRYAFPILRRYGLPATIFLTTGGLDSREPLWFEELGDAIKNTSREFVDIEIDVPRRFLTRTASERLEANTGIYGLLRKLPDTDRRRWLEDILRQLGASRDGKWVDRMLTWDQVREMKRHGIDFGGHTVTHPFLSKVTPEQAAWEVSECKRRIEDEVQGGVSFFAYPSGRDEDIAEWNRDTLCRAGYRGAVTTKWGMNYQSVDRMDLRRGGPWENTAAMFAWKMDWYQLSE